MLGFDRTLRVVKEEIHGLERDVTWFVEMAMLVVERERENEPTVCCTLESLVDACSLDFY